ncbi:UNVERIFIED_CONTAM: hypothetical protein Sradi_5652800 [Sesamum radiatum]|uniref:Uncharacterized protein n=1 Tax=Sesamum radiatum TaxID=300843 RepID=A0AAW2L2N7_SESRA
MGSAERFVGRGSVVVGEVRRQAEGACSSGVLRDENRVGSAPLRAVWSKNPDSELSTEGRESSRLQDDDTSKEHGLGNAKLILALRAEVLLQKCSKLKKSSSRCGKRSGMVQMEVSKSKVGSHDVNEVSKAPSSPASYHISGATFLCQVHALMFQKHVLFSFLNKDDYLAFKPRYRNDSISLPAFFISSVKEKMHSKSLVLLISFIEKTQVLKQKKSYNCRSGDKRNSKVHKNRCGSFSLKDGLVVFNSAAVGNNFFGIYGLKSEVIDITKYVNELSLDELLRGRCDYPSIAEDNGKNVTNSNNSLFQSYRKACSVLQDQKVHQTKKCAEINSSFIQQVSTGSMMTGSSADQTDYNRGESLTAELPSSDKVKESGDEIKPSKSVSDSPLYLPKDILERLALPPPKDLDSLLSDASKTTTPLKSCCHPRLAKTFFQRTGLPSFPWSHSFPGRSKLCADSVKLSTSRTMCNARWFKVKSSSTPQKGPVGSVWDIESLTFDQNLVPRVTLTSGSPENQTVSVEGVLSSSGACSTSRVPEELEKCHVSTLIPSGFQCLRYTRESLVTLYHATENLVCIDSSHLVLSCAQLLANHVTACMVVSIFHLCTSGWIFQYTLTDYISLRFHYSYWWMMLDEHSPTYAAAKMLCDMATYSLKENLCTPVKLVKKPPQMAKKAWKSKGSEKPSQLFNTPKSTMRSHNPVQVGDDGSPSKKLRLSTDVKHACIGHTDSVKRETYHWSAPMPPTSASRKLYRGTSSGADSYSINLDK